MQRYRILVDHRSTYNIKGMGKYGLTIMRADTGVSTARVKELFSDEELRGSLDSLGYESEEIVDILEVLTEKKASWKQTRDFDESSIAVLGF